MKSLQLDKLGPKESSPGIIDFGVFAASALALGLLL